ncbi:unnamed protein product [Clonostachys chloroleuca]|uniref:Uncharacterized protein n=1 Tax=Clonostachys chloroleuca TaxID=1926264 RepID=A0AA35Q166_9HYPO|nr:unnamed protein product [Clonostachys chloroleuca]
MAPPASSPISPARGGTRSLIRSQGRRRAARLLPVPTFSPRRPPGFICQIFLRRLDPTGGISPFFHRHATLPVQLPAGRRMLPPRTNAMLLVVNDRAVRDVRDAVGVLYTATGGRVVERAAALCWVLLRLPVPQGGHDGREEGREGQRDQQGDDERCLEGVLDVRHGWVAKFCFIWLGGGM